jgi:hypothetical protein
MNVSICVSSQTPRTVTEFRLPAREWCAYDVNYLPCSLAKRLHDSSLGLIRVCTCEQVFSQRYTIIKLAYLTAFYAGKGGRQEQRQINGHSHSRLLYWQLVTYTVTWLTLWVSTRPSVWVRKRAYSDTRTFHWQMLVISNVIIAKSTQSMCMMYTYMEDNVMVYVYFNLVYIV